MAESMLSGSTLPKQTIEVNFIRLTDTEEYKRFASLQKCSLCDSIPVVFPKYGMQGNFKIVKTEYDVLNERFNSMELGDLSTTLSEALGLSDSPEPSKTTTAVTITGDQITATTGEFVSGQYVKSGNVVQLQITFRNASSVASGSDVFYGTLSIDGIKPLISARGSGYYGAHSFVGVAYDSGAIRIRNSSSTAVSIGASNSTTVTFTYIA